MIKILSVFVFLASNIYAMSFDDFLNKALTNSPYLHSYEVSKKQIKFESEILTRYKNPSLGLEYAKFQADNRVNDDGYSLSLSQSLYPLGLGNDRKKLGNLREKSADATFILKRAKLREAISLVFVEYAKIKELSTLAEEELSIAQAIFSVAKARFEAGTISQGEVLQAQVDYEMVQIRLASLDMNLKEKYFMLLNIAGYDKEIVLDYKHTFTLSNADSAVNNPDLKLFLTRQKTMLASAQVNSYAMESFDIEASYEKEPDQDIYRIGLAIPLTVFNTKTQEVQIAKLQAKKESLYEQKQNAKNRLRLLQLQQERISLDILSLKNETSLTTQEKLLHMFEESYKIANVNLLELQNIKNGVIQTKEALILIKFTLDANTIKTNYITGAYNE